jgi:hypothetical protein
MCNIFWFSSMGNLGSVIKQTIDVKVIPLAELLVLKDDGIEVLFRWWTAYPLSLKLSPLADRPHSDLPATAKDFLFMIFYSFAAST